MQIYNSFNISIYTLLFNALRLTLLILFAILGLLQLSCYKKTNLLTSQPKFLQTPYEHSLNINLASVEELKKLPKVGEELARQIIEHREKYGKFRRTEHLILVRGMTDKKFREIKHLVKTE